MKKLPKLKPQGENEKDNDFSNRKAKWESQKREFEKGKQDRDRFELEATMKVPPHIAAFRRVFEKK